VGDSAAKDPKHIFVSGAAVNENGRGIGAGSLWLGYAVDKSGGREFRTVVNQLREGFVAHKVCASSRIGRAFVDFQQKAKKMRWL
jgi:hypothetical protein